MSKWAETDRFCLIMERIEFGREVCGQLRKSLAPTLILLALVAAKAPNPALEARARFKASFQLVPSSIKVLVQREIQFTPKGASRRSLSWYVNDVLGGNATVGLISPAGLYAAPASVPPGGGVTVKAVEPNLSRIATAAVTVIYETQTGTPLRRSKANPRYFENSGGLVFLTGSHTWNDVQDRGASDPPAAPLP